MRKRSYVWSALSFAVMAIAVSASATVTQVDGNIVPETNNMQAFLRAHGEEPSNPNNGGPFTASDVDPIADASEEPTQFLPDTTKKVTFEDIGEGAGFENSFGWYNVGDDVSTAAGRIKNLHVVLGVNVSMTKVYGPGSGSGSGSGSATACTLVGSGSAGSDNSVHYGDPTEYKMNAEETDGTNGSADPGFIQVDFAEEQCAGRYKGGFISFYLITPEGSPAGDNNGDFTVTTGSNAKSKLGKIYFTDKDLNNDGDFVHYLIYASKLKPKSFIFGFEDLFRGGDNDFEDMLVRVTGLTPPCIPQTEICDGQDNDCDGLVDEAGSGGLPGVGSACVDSTQKGECQHGTTVCEGSGGIVCVSNTGPTAEVCDLKDNNCDGLVDNNPTDPSLGIPCDGPDADACKEGSNVCQNGMIVCSDNTGNNVEICNNIDDNCNGTVDEGDPGGGGACGSATGVCTQGVLHCQGGTLKCVGGTQPGIEKCNGLDDNCDGIIDNNPTDVGSACGSSNVGACKLGQTICESGSIVCAGQVGPTTETCNNIDDDCDGTVDENPVDSGQPCGLSIGACSPGHFVCVTGGVLQCQGGVGPGSEICNGIDDDCDGIVDEDVPGVGSACGAGGSGACAAGVEQCINGSMQCVGGTGSGTEVCNGIDDDCDGKVDEGDLCNGGICDHGVCAAPCVAGEFPCPQGKKCDDNNFCVDDPCFGVNCPPDMDGNEQTCQGSTCAPICNTVTCGSDFVCRGRDGACVPNTCDYIPTLCTSGQICANSQCVTDPCAGVTCGTDQFCRAGTCIQSCQGVECDDTQVCQDGACVATGCPAACPTGQVCDGSAGQCVTSKCDGVSCGPNLTCDPVTGSCIADPCSAITCPDGQACSLGQCGVGTHGQLVTAAGGGCDAGGGAGSAGGFALVGLILGGLLLRRRALRAVLLPLAAAGALATSGCKLNNYCIDCETGDGGMGSNGGSDAGSGGSNGDGGVTCDPNAVHQETCNGADDDCDGLIDEGFNTQTDPLNCGACGVQCNKPGAQTTCNNGQCVITGCFPGFEDVDGDTSGPYASSDGCEYMCFQSNGGAEACDRLDNDCDGTIDEGIDVSSDVNNCGQCGRQCDFFEATGHCGSGNCFFNAPTDCAAGFVDADHMQADGCEYSCTKTNGGVEKCDLIDNDCDGVVDNGFDLNTDKNNCGRCGLVCSFAHATPSCSAGACAFNPATDCQPGFVDANHMQLDGCEYQCTKTNGGLEICDGKDNDCDGIVDEMSSDAGGACSSVTPPKGICQANGVLTCAAGHLVCTGATEATVETCNNMDDDCDGTIDDGVARSCYDGSASTNGVGVCHGGTETCSAGVFSSVCSGEVVPTTEKCNGVDDDCNGMIDDGPGGTVLTQSCYTGSAGTAGFGTCKAGTQTCAFGTFGTTCPGQVVPTTDVCGDGLDTDCDGKNDAAEGCLAEDAEIRLDAPGGTLGTGSGAQHSHDVQIAVGGFPFGTNVYAVWNDLVSGQTEVYIRKSTDGGKTWGAIVNVTSSFNTSAVEPAIAVQAAGSGSGSSDTVVVTYQAVPSSEVRNIEVQRSTDGGTTWGAAVTLDASGNGDTADSFHQAVAISGQTVVVTWEQLSTTTLNRDVMSKTSTDGGATFGSLMTINSSSGNTTRFAGRPQVGITSGLGVVWAWREQRNGATRDIFAAHTATATTAPTSDVRIDGDSGDNRDSDFPVLSVVGTAAYLVWQDVSTNTSVGANVLFSHSTDSGATWTSEVNIDDPGTHVSNSFTPAMAVNAGASATDPSDDVVAIVWEDRRQGTEIFSSTSTDGGSTFGAATRVSNDANDPESGTISLPSIAAAPPNATNNKVFVCSWQNQADANSNVHVFSSSTIDNGVSWTYTAAQLDGGAGDALAPKVAGTLITSKPAGVTVWNDFRSGIKGDIYAAASH